jgi:hypothetical protein
MPDKLTDALRKMALLEEPATVERMHLYPDEPGCVPDVMEPRGRNEIRGFVGLEHCGSLLRFPRDTFGMRKAIRQAGEKLAGEVLSGWDRLGHQSTR